MSARLLMTCVLMMVFCAVNAHTFLSSKNNNQGKTFFDQHGLIIFYSSACPHCREFAPIIKTWSTINHAKLLPISFDNQPLPEFPHFIPASTEWINAAFSGQSITYPATFIVNPQTQKIFPVGFGSMTEEELNLRMNAVIPKIEAYEKSRDI